MGVEQFMSVRGFEGNGLGLLVIVTQHQTRHVVGHGGQQGDTLLVGHVTGSDRPGQQDLDVDLVIRAIHPG